MSDLDKHIQVNNNAFSWENFNTSTTYFKLKFHAKWGIVGRTTSYNALCGDVALESSMLSRVMS